MKKEEEYKVNYKYDIMNVIIHDLHNLLDSLSGAIYSLDRSIEKRNVKSDSNITNQLSHIKSVKSQIGELLQLYHPERHYKIEPINFSNVLNRVIKVLGKYRINSQEYNSKREVEANKEMLSLILYSFFSEITKMHEDKNSPFQVTLEESIDEILVSATIKSKFNFKKKDLVSIPKFSIRKFHFYGCLEQVEHLLSNNFPKSSIEVLSKNDNYKIIQIKFYG